MKKLMILACSIVGLMGTVNAQSAYKKKAGNAPATNQTTPAPATNQPAAAKTNRGISQIGNAPAQGANANTNPAAAGNAAAGNAAAGNAGMVSAQADTIPIEFDTTSRIQKSELSLRNPFATDRSQNRDRRPLEYEHLREDDNMWSEFIWREIDSREKINQSSNYPGTY